MSKIQNIELNIEIDSQAYKDAMEDLKRMVYKHFYGEDYEESWMFIEDSIRNQHEDEK